VSGVILLILRVALTLALYSFVGWAIFTIWRDLRQQSLTLAARQAPPLIATVALGQNEQRHYFTATEIIIGRAAHCQCQIPSQTVSSQHARLFFQQGHWWVEDLDSTNGTLLNAEPVTKATIVVPGDKIRCGEALLVLEPALEGAPTPLEVTTKANPISS